MSDWLTAAIKKIEDMPQQAKDVRQAAMDIAIMTKTNCCCCHERT